jgi:hypothetical protein
MLENERRRRGMAWSNDELDKMAAAEELELQTTRDDGTLRNPVTIWMVRVGDDVYVRSVKGTVGKWYWHAAGQPGKVSVGGVEKEVTFEKAGDEANDAVDAAYRAKYGRYPERVLGSVLTPEARESTLRLVTRQWRN